MNCECDVNFHFNSFAEWNKQWAQGEERKFPHNMKSKAATAALSLPFFVQAEKVRFF